VLLIGFAFPIWAKNVSHFPEAKDSTVIQIMAQQFAWNARYPGLDGNFGRQDMKLISNGNIFGVDPADTLGKDDVQVLNDIHVPVNKPVKTFKVAHHHAHHLMVAKHATHVKTAKVSQPVKAVTATPSTTWASWWTSST